MKVYTKAGDKGTTQILGESARVVKFDPRLHALGTLDETNACVGHVLAALDVHQTVEAFDGVRGALGLIQNWLFEVGASLTTSEDLDLSKHVEQMETWIDGWDAELPELKNFILPAGHETTTRIHMTRAVVRRAERWIVESCVDWAIPFVNRLSDLLFVLARYIDLKMGKPEVIWKSS